MNQKYLKVAVDAPLPSPLTYLPNETLLSRGDSVFVPLGRRTVKAVVLGETQDSGDFELKQVMSHNEQRPQLPEAFIKWLEWLSSYYLHPIGQVTSSAFPPLKKTDKIRRSQKAPVVPSVESLDPPKLTDEQVQCCNDILKEKGFDVHLLHGVTGSGKTEVYLQILKAVLDSGKKGIVIVPEISLTPQLIGRFSSRFPDQVAVIHSHLTEREKTNQWWNIIDGKKSILIGARSALFCPIDNLGLIVVDEEHEPSFKQDEKLKYHARDASIMLAKYHDCKVILGSATPSLESWKNVTEGKFKLHEMKSRVAHRKMPGIEVVDMRELKHENKKSSKESELPFWLSPLLFEKMTETYKSGKQSALFLNRRGMAQVVLCHDCGHVQECPNCAISLTLHAHRHLVCHYCDYSEKLLEVCPQCQTGELQPLGLGTELIENDIRKLFPDANIARADRDEISTREDLVSLVENMEAGVINILIGTQMIAKGLDFPELTLVGLVMADVGFNLPDFRTSERSFQLLTQMSGRSGRHSSEPGQVVIQTYNPDHLSITYTINNDYIGFAERELAARKELSYPPYGRLASVRIQGIKYDNTFRTSNLLAKRAQGLIQRNEAYKDVLLLGPTPSPLAKIRNKFRFHMLIKCPNPSVINAFCKQLTVDLSWVSTGTKVQVDMDPMNML